MVELFATTNTTQLDSDDVSIGTVVTDANGFYRFASLIPEKNYFIQVRSDPKQSFTQMDVGANVGSSDATDSDVNPGTGRSALWQANRVVAMDVGVLGTPTGVESVIGIASVGGAANGGVSGSAIESDFQSNVIAAIELIRWLSRL